MSKTDDMISRKAAIEALGKEGLITAMVISDRVPSAQTVARDINVLSNDLIIRQAAIDALGERPIVWTDDDEYALGERNQYDIDRLAIETVPSAQSKRTCLNCGRTANNGGWYADGRTRCPIEEHYALPKDGFCHLWEKRNVTDDDYPERRTDE